MITAEFSAKLGQHREISRKTSGMSRDEELKRLGLSSCQVWSKRDMKWISHAFTDKEALTSFK